MIQAHVGSFPLRYAGRNKSKKFAVKQQFNSFASRERPWHLGTREPLIVQIGPNDRTFDEERWFINSLEVRARLSLTGNVA
ncbi:hypothetical protein FB004_12021 [Sinorhizobium medicae]|uniref:Uncharacterized protein n=1 Tax=Sinorhizobium medicae TaxID=110321 RepID=A0A508X6F4_9HYPH|nr:hypothetical protein BMJ34_22800 [Sinorhizobium medicae]PLU07623.1 hypothetical protein BMJ33_04255 [Sinorhizobium medicae]PLU11064.1 hypothetical protein BMJ30_31675 [Sinorhizobium medicae]PLU11528.1 hypothetical protein BMJ29_34685 [Sinorhizobium medicae]PLU36758.1 hypothetical protein BMJ27_09490 [Sinorhizobium medicae]